MAVIKRAGHSSIVILAAMFVYAACAVAGPWNSDNGLILKGTVVTMTGEEAVIENGRILILNEQIAAIVAEGEPWPADVDPSGAVVLDTNGYIFPGMINVHNHTAYSTLPLWEAPGLYQNRYQWMEDENYKTGISCPKTLLNGGDYFNLAIEVAKYAEVKGLVGGETSIQGASNIEGVNDMLIRNVEARNFGRAKVFQRCLSIEDNEWQKTVPAFLAMADDGMVDAWIVHLAEGVDADPSLNEFKVLTELNMLHDWTVVVHGTALTETEFETMGSAGADLAWSPLSNLLLYGKTTRIDQAVSAGVNVSLSTDWSPSGCKNLLDELKIAFEVNIWYGRTLPGYLPLDEYTLARMVTINPARALEWDSWLGTLEVGKYADLMVIVKPDMATTPYQALIAATVRDVVIVIVSGEPLYGDVWAMRAAKGSDMEFIYSSAGFEKAIDLTRDGRKKGEQTWESLTGILRQAMKFDHEQMHSTFKVSSTAGWTREEFDAWFESEFGDGVTPMDLDPVFATDDPGFFRRIATSSNASLPFDLQALYYSSLMDYPAASECSGPDEVDNDS